MEKVKDSKHLQLGKYGEQIAKAEFIRRGFDVYSTEVDDKGIDFIVKNKIGKVFEIQVKTTNGKYVFMRKEVFKPSENLYLAYLTFDKDDKPVISLIPSLEWKKKDKYKFFVDRNYEWQKSKPEYGINYSKKAVEIIRSNFSFKKMITNFET